MEVVILPPVVCMQAVALVGAPGVFYHGSQNDMDVFAEYYGLPLVSLRACCWRLMAANVTGRT
jgi:hypothetical protein